MKFKSYLKEARTIAKFNKRVLREGLKDDKLLALSQVLNLTDDEAKYIIHIDEEPIDFYAFDNEHYLVLTKEESDKMFKEAQDDFLEHKVFLKLDDDIHKYFDIEAWKADSNKGELISTYDGTEYKTTVNSITYYIYRIN